MSVRQELEKILAEVSELRKKVSEEEVVKGVKQFGKDAGLEQRFTDMRQMLAKMLDETEETVSGHPLPTIAGALALGILIGWMTGHQGKST